MENLINEQQRPRIRYGVTTEARLTITKPQKYMVVDSWKLAQRIAERGMSYKAARELAELLNRKNLGGE